MKKTLIALAVLASAGSVNAAEILKTDTASVDFYGQLREEIKQISYDAGKLKSTQTSTSVSSGSSRAGVNARYAVSSDLDVLATVEFGIGQTNSGDNRKHYIGFASKDYGTLTLGKQSILTDDIWGVENDYIGWGYSVLPEADGYDMNWLQDAMLKYSFQNDSGWVRAAYSYDNGKSDPETAELYAGTTFGNFDVYGGLGYQRDETSTDASVVADNGKAKVKPAATKDTTLTHGMLTVNYNGEGWNLGTTYWHAKVEDDTANTNTTLNTDSYVVAGSYSVTKKTSVFGGFEYIDDFQEEDNTYNNTYAGVLYQYASWSKLYVETGISDDNRYGTDRYYGIGTRLYW
ncbi:porin [Vibrio zhugei]|uniref:Porin n=1 Tax=Vibrio zhugei TaxID=2479546 RepID=A0ABV7CET5_9VIBR|nr:porin [Vibrio zhugei]